MIRLVDEVDYPTSLNGQPVEGKTFEEALDEYLNEGWAILALDLAATIPAGTGRGSPFDQHPRWRAVLHKADA